MRLIDLHPIIRENQLMIDCPGCLEHRAHIPLVGTKDVKRTWSIYNDPHWDKVEVRPSVNIPCCTFTINNGEVRVAQKNN